MPITYDISTDYLYKQGEIKGIQKGVQKAIEGLIKQGGLSDIQIAEATGRTVEFVETVRKEMKK